MQSARVHGTLMGVKMSILRMYVPSAALRPGWCDSRKSDEADDADDARLGVVPASVCSVLNRLARSRKIDEYGHKNALLRLFHCLFDEQRNVTHIHPYKWRDGSQQGENF